MKRFTDNAGREWLVEVNVAAVERVRTACDLDLLSAVDPRAGLLEKLAADPVLLVGVLWTLLQEQAEMKHVSPEQFGRAMGGDALDAGAEALGEALIGFFPRLRRRLLQQAVEKMVVEKERAFAAAAEFLDSPEFQEEMSRRLEGLKSSFGQALESSASIPDGGPSAGSSPPPRPASGPTSTAGPG